MSKRQDSQWSQSWEANMKISTAILVFALSLPCWGIRHRARPIKHEDRLFPPSTASLRAQNAAVDAMGLERYNDAVGLFNAIVRGDLIPLDPKLKTTIPSNRRYARPWINGYLVPMDGAFYETFRKHLVVTSAVRTRQVQRWLRRHNRNAAPIHGETESSHMAGATIDIGRSHLTREQTQWVEMYLWELDVRNLVIVEEERGCFHIMLEKRF